ncbi:MAG: substrate-binding domain-containing protein, partial [Alphaproteobacteria bacterium]|nr:substrate-binding domain-containing protein [Alphaproteobacteria bacterium]
AGVFPGDTHAPIIYPVALTKGAKPEARSFLTFLESDAAAALFRKAGFTVLPGRSK